MKKSNVILMVLALASIALVAFGADGFGMGKPYTRTPAAIGELYVDQVNNSLWRANSTTKGDFSLVNPQIGNGSAVAPMPTLYTDVLVFTDPMEVTIGATASLTVDISGVCGVLVNATATGDILKFGAGLEGQILAVTLVGMATETDSLVVTPATGTAVTLDALGEGCIMLYANDRWFTIGKNN
jgi:hypothetical protein